MVVSTTGITIGGAPGAFADLLLGEQVIVTGVLQADGTILAVSLVVPAATIGGTIQSIATDGLTIGAQPILVSATTEITVAGAPALLSDLKVGMQAAAVEVIVNGTFNATTVAAQ